MIVALNNLPRVVKFGMVGAFGAVLKISLMYLFTSVFGVFYLVSYAIVFGASVLSNFTLNSLWTFNTTFHDKGWRMVANGLMRYSGIAAITLLINEAVVYTSTGVFGYHYIIGTIAAVFVAFLFNFTMSKRFVWVV